MNRFLYARLAASNIRKNISIYLPYALLCVLAVSMFYIMLFLTMSKGLQSLPGADALSTIMSMGCIVIGIFSAIILLYSNSFLMKRRQKELGLYNILGMEKRHIAWVMAFETLYTSVLCLAVGLFTGILLSKLILALLVKLLTFRVPFGFEVPPAGLAITALLFLGIFFVTLLLNLARVHLLKPIELLQGGSVGEREPKTKWLLVTAGLASLGAGYAIALTKQSPLEALNMFFIAVILVIAGTYCLFTAGSIALLKILRANRKYYYKTNHFTSVSGMIYRMKRNAVGLANICVISTMVLVMLSTTVSLYAGLEDALRVRCPRNVEIKISRMSESDCGTLHSRISGILAESGIPVRNAIGYRYLARTCRVSGVEVMADTGDIPLEERAAVYFLTLEDYNRLQNSAETLMPGEVLVYSPDSSFGGRVVYVGGAAHRVKAMLESLNVVDNYGMSLNRSIFLIMPDDQSVKDAFLSLTGSTADWPGFEYYYGFDTDSPDYERAASKLLTVSLSGIAGKGGEGTQVRVESACDIRNDFLSVYGGLFFLGLFLSALFIMSTAVIMYYKQVSEGFEDRLRFEIMQKVGLDRDEIRKTIRSQVLTVFFLPLAMAGMHILAAFKMITKLLLVMNLTNVGLFAVCTVVTFAAFAAVYAVVYSLTARAYYKIVS